MRFPHARPTLLALPLVALAILAAGCGGAVPSSNGGPAGVKLGQSKLGRVLVDRQGRSLYLFDADKHGESYCHGACASVWPPLETSAAPRGLGGVSASALGTIKRDDGDTQVTYHGHPLYYYAGDASTAGKTTGQEIDQFGDEWYLVRSNGKPAESESHSSGDHSGGGGSEGGGYG